MYIYTPLGRYWIILYMYVLGFIVPHVNIQLEDNKQYISNTPIIMIHLSWFEKEMAVLLKVGCTEEWGT